MTVRLQEEDTERHHRHPAALRGADGFAQHPDCSGQTRTGVPRTRISRARTDGRDGQDLSILGGAFSEHEQSGPHQQTPTQAVAGDSEQP